MLLQPSLGSGNRRRRRHCCQDYTSKSRNGSHDTSIVIGCIAGWCSCRSRTQAQQQNNYNNDGNKVWTTRDDGSRDNDDGDGYGKRCHNTTIAIDEAARSHEWQAPPRLRIFRNECLENRYPQHTIISLFSTTVFSNCSWSCRHRQEQDHEHTCKCC